MITWWLLALIYLGEVIFFDTPVTTNYEERNVCRKLKWIKAFRAQSGSQFIFFESRPNQLVLFWKSSKIQEASLFSDL